MSATRVVKGEPTVKMRGAVLQLSGPPCAGKSTRLRELAEQYPNAVILDDWSYHRSLGTPSRDLVPSHQWERWYAHLDTAIFRNPPGGLLAYIQGRPVPRFRGVRVEVIDPGIDVCHARAEADNRPPITHQWIADWYAKYRRAMGPQQAQPQQAPGLP